MVKKTLVDLKLDGNSTWILIQKWLENSSVSYEVLEPTREKAENVLLSLQVSTKSTLGAIAYETGGILIDNGWLNILGSGNEKIFGDLVQWNKEESKNINNALIVAYDIIGGFFVINGGAFKGDIGNIFYLSPDTLEWEDMGIGYTDFIAWILDDNFKKFYEGLRWDNWESDISVNSPNNGFSFYPPLWSEQGSVFLSSRKSIPIKEIWELNLEYIEKFK